MLGARGIVGLLGRTDVLSPGTLSPQYHRLDRRLYGPLCLLLSVATATAVRRRDYSGEER